MHLTGAGNREQVLFEADILFIAAGVERALSTGSSLDICNTEEQSWLDLPAYTQRPKITRLTSIVFHNNASE